MANCGRKVFLLGGPYAEIEPQSNIISIWPKTTDGQFVEIEIDSYGKLFYTLKKKVIFRLLVLNLLPIIVNI